MRSALPVRLSSRVVWLDGFGSSVTVCLLVALLSLGFGHRIPAAVAQSTGGIQPLAGSNQIQVSPTDASEPDRPASSGPFAADSFTISNIGTTTVTGITLSCISSGPVTCSSLNINGFPGTLTAGQQWKGVIPSYTTGTHGSAAIGVEADLDVHGSTPSQGWSSVNVVSDPPTVAFVVPAATTGRAVVHNRQPVVRATFLPSNGAIVDTSKTVLTWRGDTVSWLARHNRGLLEWEVDSTRWLNVGDSAQAVLKACSVNGACTTASLWVVLLNDQLPVLGFTGRPLESLGSEFGAPFGPGLAVSGGEVETSVGTPAYVSMGVARSAGLVYSTRQAYPRALVPVDLEVPWPAGTPDQIKLILSEGGTKLDSLVLTSPTCATGAVKRCRAVLQADYGAASFSAPVRKWLTVEARITSGATTVSATDSTEIVLVGRRGTPYGSGWWPAGVGQLVSSGSDELLIAPNGSGSIYRGNGDSVYVPSPGNFAALLKTSTGWMLQARATLAQVRFDTLGRQVASVDPNGNRDSIAYLGTTTQITSLIDPVGKAIHFYYDANVKLDSIVDPGGRRSAFTVSGPTWILTKDSISSPTARPNVTTFVYQAYTGTNGTSVLTKRVGVLLDTTIVTYDSTFRRRPVSVRLPRVPDENGTTQTPVISYKAYEGRGFAGLISLDSVYVEVKDPRNNWTRSLLNRWGESRKTWDALGTLSKATYDADGLVLSTEGKNGDSSRVYTDYDRYRRLMRTWITRGGNVLRLDSLVYDTNQRLLQRFDSRGQYRLFFYDAAGNLVRTLSPNNDSTLVWYRSDGLVDSTRVPGIVKAIRNVYDATWKNVVQTLGPSGDTVMTNSFDNLGRTYRSDQKIAVQDSIGATVIYYQWRRAESFFNSAGQVDSTHTLRTDNCTGAGCSSPSWPALSDTVRTQRVSVVYDRAGRDSLRVTSHGAKTLYVYDRIGRLLARHPWIDSLAVVDTMGYDVAGNLKKTITRRGYTITTGYDSRNRDTLTVVPTVGTILKSYGGPLDQLTRIWMTGYVDSLGGVNPEVRFGYDSRGRLVADTTYTGTTPRVTTYTYDTYERPSTMVDPLGTWTTKYETKRGMADTLITPYGDNISYVYDSLKRAIGPTIYNGSLRASTGIKWLVNGTLLADTTLVQSSGGAYVAGGYGRPVTNDTSYLALQPVWKDRHGSGASTDQLADSATYDGWERLVQWKGTKNTTTLVGSESYTFDANGNISQPTGTAVYDRVTDRLVSRIEGATTRVFRYDRGGFLTNDSLTDNSKRWGFGYDALGRLVSVRYNGVVVARYGYDVLGRRIAKRVYSTSSGGTVGYTRFVYHGQQIAFETDSAGAVGLRYTYGLGEDALVAVRDAAGNHYYTVGDKLGSIRGLVKQDGTWWLSQRFSPYGVTIQRDTSSAGASVPLRFGWIGREYDAETGYYYLRARYYSPALRRFVAEDPLGYGGGSGLYAYAEGMPLESTDRDGLMNAVPEGYAEYWADLMSKIQGAQMMGGGGGPGGGYSVDGVEVSSQMGGMAMHAPGVSVTLATFSGGPTLFEKSAGLSTAGGERITGGVAEMSAYELAKAQITNCAAGFGCDNAADQAAAQFGLGILQSAEEGDATLAITFSEGGPLGTSVGSGAGRDVYINAADASARGLDLSAVVAHEVGEAYLYSVYRPNALNPQDDYSFYQYAHPMAVVFLEDPARMGAGEARRVDIWGPDK